MTVNNKSVTITLTMTELNIITEGLCKELEYAIEENKEIPDNDLGKDFYQEQEESARKLLNEFCKLVGRKVVKA